MECVLDKLVGKTIKEIWVSPDQGAICFVANSSSHKYECYGDCCSETWIADIIGVGSLLGATVSSVRDLELPQEPDGRSRQDKDDFYGLGIKTSKGDATIAYRNSSNGYYGGSMSESETFAGRLPDISGWIQITQDYSA